MKTLTRLSAALLSLTLTCGTAWSADNPAQWVPVKEISLTVQPGSPLDFSGFLQNGTIDAGHRLVANPDGRLAFAAEPDKPQRFLCASLAFGPAGGGFPDHAGADAYARQLAMHGYNIARFHFADASLMNGRSKDFDFDPEILDRIHYMMAALKKNGIYWIVDGLTSWRGGLGGYDDRWDPSEGLKLEINYDDKAFQHWKRLVTAFLDRVNPYTDRTPLRDDALALVVMANENGMEFSNIVYQGAGGGAYSDSLKTPFNAWLRKRYGSTQGLRAVWPDLRANERVENASVRLPEDRYADSPRLRDLQIFFTETEHAAAARMTKVFRDLGYRGLVTDYNNWPSNQASLGRENLPAIAMNTYHDWVSGYQPGSKIEGKSSLADAGNYFRFAAATRWLGKPFVMTEYDHLFWNPYRYESGLLMPAYAALQGWDALCRHGQGPIVLQYGEPFPHKRAILPYVIALDPVARAGETLAALLYRRGDVSEARDTIPFMVRGTEDLTDDMQAHEPETLTLLSLVARIGLKQANGLREPMAVNQPRDKGDAIRLFGEMKAAGMVKPENRTTADGNLIQSETGEITLDRNRLMLTVSTPRTNAAAYAKLDAPVDLGALRIEGGSSGLISASALDGTATLAESKRMLLIFATDARNTGMHFRDADEKVIEDFGRLPVLIRKGGVKLSFPGRSARWRISPVGLDGTVYAPTASGDGPIAFDLSNTPGSGPTTFFLLETD